MNKIILLLFLFPFSAFAELPKPATDDEIKCMRPHDGQQWRYEHGQRIPMDLWLEQHPEKAESYYRERAELRKRYKENKRAGICP